MTLYELLEYRVWLIKAIFHLYKRTGKLDFELLDACWHPYEYKSNDTKGDVKR